MENQTETMVCIKLPKLREAADDVFVAVNNRTWLIKRGVQVEVPACVAEVLQHADEMADEAERFEMSVQRAQ